MFWRLIGSVITTTMLVLPSGTFALDPSPERMSECEPMPSLRPGPMMGMPPPPMLFGMELPSMVPMPFLLKQLALTEAQRDKLFDLGYAQIPAMRERLRSVVKTMEDLRRLAASDPFDPQEAKIMADAHGRAVAELARMQVEMDAQLRAELTPAQRRRMDEELSRHAGVTGARRQEMADPSALDQGLPPQRQAERGFMLLKRCVISIS